jgi:hypothetical protein
MGYLTTTDVPEVIKDFYFEETVSELTGEMVEEAYTYIDYDDEGNETGEVEATRLIPEYHDVIYVRQVTKPETKSLTDLERLIKLAKPETIIKKFAGMVALGYQWEWFDLYKAFEEELTSWEEAKEAFEPVTDEEEGTTTEFTLEAPVSPLRPPLQAGEDVYLPYTREALKKARKKAVDNISVEVDDLVFDGDELSQTRMAKALLTMKVSETISWVLKNNETASITKATLKAALKAATTKQSLLWKIS